MGMSQLWLLPGVLFIVTVPAGACSKCACVCVCVCVFAGGQEDTTHKSAKWRQWPAGDCTAAIHPKQGIVTGGAGLCRSALLRSGLQIKEEQGRRDREHSHVEYRQGGCLTVGHMLRFLW